MTFPDEDNTFSRTRLGGYTSCQSSVCIVQKRRRVRKCSRELSEFDVS